MNTQCQLGYEGGKNSNTLNIELLGIQINTKLSGSKPGNMCQTFKMCMIFDLK